MMALRYVTIATPGFLPMACVLAESLARHEPGARLTCCLVGMDGPVPGLHALPFDVLHAESLPVPDRQRYLFQYSTKELCCAFKPHLLQWALRQGGADAAIYLDADTYLCAPVGEVFSGHLSRAAIMVTPHLLHPDLPPHVGAILRAGTYNAGVLGVGHGEQAAAFLDWWTRCLETDCIRDAHGGYSADQRWLDLAAGMFASLLPLRDPGVNVGFWNLHERRPVAGAGEWQVQGGGPLRLFHFSHVHAGGFAPFAAANTGDNHGGAVGELLAEYHAGVCDWTARCPPPVPSCHEFFTDGTPISPAQREAVRTGLVSCDDPFRERALVEQGTPANAEQLFGRRAGFWAESGPALVGEARARLARIRGHVVFGPLLAAWRRWVNPDL